MLKIKTFTFNLFEERTLLMWDDENKEAVVVDPGCCSDFEYDALMKIVTLERLSLKAIWLTHGHLDHIYGVSRLVREFGLPVMMHPYDVNTLAWNQTMAERFGMEAPVLGFGTMDILNGDVLSFGNVKFMVYETPGHTPGSVCFYDEADKVLLSGDTLFAGSIGRTDFPGGDYDKLIVSLMDGIMGLDGDVDVIPGHGGTTNISHERTHNPFLQPFNEPEENMPEGGFLS